MPLGEWMSMLWRSRRIARREPSLNVVDVDHLENHGTADSEGRIFLLALDRKSDDADEFEPT